MGIRIVIEIIEWHLLIWVDLFLCTQFRFLTYVCNKKLTSYSIFIYLYICKWLLYNSRCVCNLLIMKLTLRFLGDCWFFIFFWYRGSFYLYHFSYGFYCPHPLRKKILNHERLCVTAIFVIGEQKPNANIPGGKEKGQNNC